MIPLAPKDPTLEAVKLAMQAKQSLEPRRGYLGASLIGEQCARKIWYAINQDTLSHKLKPYSFETLAAFDDGHRTEQLVIDRLRMVEGIELFDKDEGGKQFGFSHLGGKLRGHVDGIIKGLKQAPSAVHVLEVKCSADKKFNEFCSIRAAHGEKKTLKKWNEQYFVQAQLYMHFMQIDRHYLVCALAGGRDMQSCRTEYEPEVALKYIDRAEKILDSRTEPPRISDKPDFWQCRFCNYAEHCHKK